jgi:hypothetical protein
MLRSWLRALVRSLSTTKAPRRTRLSLEALETRAVPSAAPAAPTFTAAAASSSQVNLSWNSVSGATGYKVDEWNGSSWVQLASLGGSATTDSITGLHAGTTYYFDVAAVNSSGTTWAAYKSVTTPQAAPAAPTLTATAVSSSQVNLSWTSVSGATSYTVDQWNGSSWVKIATVTGTSYSVTGLNAGTTYYFDVGAVNSSGTTWAAYKSATTSSGGTTVTTNEPTASGSYSNVSGNLFGSNGPSYLDVKQGQVGDCWLLSSLAEVAARDPQDITGMFTYKGTTVENGVTVGLYSVRFYNSAGVAQYVTVDTELPDGGKLYDQASSGPLWVALAEKAYAEANGMGIVTTSDPHVDSYNALNGGDPAWALQAITGKSANEYSINPTNLAAAWNAGQLIVLYTGQTTASSYIVPDHAYAVVGYTASSSNPFEVYNPWGTNSSGMALGTYNGHQVYGLFNTNSTFLAQNYIGQATGAASANHLHGALALGGGTAVAPSQNVGGKQNPPAGFPSGNGGVNGPIYVVPPGLWESVANNSSFGLRRDPRTGFAQA